MGSNIMMHYKNSKIVLFLGLLVLVSLVIYSCNREQPVQQELKNPFIEAVKRIDGRLNTVQAKGKKIYNQYCNICHGETGKGDGFNAYNLDPRPADLTEVCKMKEDEYIIRVVTEGTKVVGKSSLCPPYGRIIQKGDAGMIISYLKTFSDSK